MRHGKKIIAIILLVFGVAFWGRWQLRGDSRPSPQTTGDCRRIVSLAPSITETLFELGLGDRVVAVTDYCKFPPEAQNKPKIGGYLDCNCERIALLEPDLVVGLDVHRETLPRLKELGIGVLTVSHLGVDDLPTSIMKIGTRCGEKEKAKALVADINRRLDKIAKKTAGLKTPSVLVVVDRARAAGRLRDIYISGNEEHVGRIVELAGGRNAYQGTVRFPLVSTEGITEMNPDVILDCIPQELADGGREKALLKHWKELDSVAAVKNGRVYAVTDDHATIPGPNFVDTVEQFLGHIHPETE